MDEYNFEGDYDDRSQGVSSDVTSFTNSIVNLKEKKHKFFIEEEAKFALKEKKDAGFPVDDSLLSVRYGFEPPRSPKRAYLRLGHDFKTSLSSDEIKKQNQGQNRHVTLPLNPKSTKNAIDKKQRREKEKEFRMSRSQGSLASAIHIRTKYYDDIVKKKELEKTVFDEIKNMESKIYTCIEEANNYCVTLELHFKYRAYLRNRICTGHSRKERGVPGTIANRIAKLQIMKLNNLTLEETLISLDRFFLDHAKLYALVLKRRALMPSGAVIKERLLERDIESKMKSSAEFGGRKPNHTSSKSLTSSHYSSAINLNSEYNKNCKMQSYFCSYDKIDDDVACSSPSQIQVRKVLQVLKLEKEDLYVQVNNIASRGWNNSILDC
jgi:hypothetical protein